MVRHPARRLAVSATNKPNVPSDDESGKAEPSPYNLYEQVIALAARHPAQWMNGRVRVRARAQRLPLDHGLEAALEPLRALSATAQAAWLVDNYLAETKRLAAEQCDPHEEMRVRARTRRHAAEAMRRIAALIRQDAPTAEINAAKWEAFRPLSDAIETLPQRVDADGMPEPWWDEGSWTRARAASLAAYDVSSSGGLDTAAQYDAWWLELSILANADEDLAGSPEQSGTKRDLPLVYMLDFAKRLKIPDRYAELARALRDRDVRIGSRPKWPTRALPHGGSRTDAELKIAVDAALRATADLLEQRDRRARLRVPIRVRGGKT